MEQMVYTIRRKQKPSKFTKFNYIAKITCGWISGIGLTLTIFSADGDGPDWFKYLMIFFSMFIIGLALCLYFDNPKRGRRNIVRAIVMSIYAIIYAAYVIFYFCREMKYKRKVKNLVYRKGKWEGGYYDLYMEMTSEFKWSLYRYR